jgi:hypothetical protein
LKKLPGSGAAAQFELVATDSLDELCNNTNSFLKVEAQARSGNQLQKLANAVGVAMKLGVTRVLCPGLIWLPRKFEVRGVIVSQNQNDFRSDWPHITGRFFYRSEVESVFGPLLSVPAVLKLIRRGDWAIKDRRTDNDELTVYLRSEDIFSSKPHPRYGQPPFSYYRLVIESYGWKKLRLVCADFRNPVAIELLKKYPDFSVTGQSLVDAVSSLWAASNLAVGHGTFPLAFAAASGNLHKLFSFETAAGAAWPLEELCETHLQYRDRLGLYRQTVQRRWRNSAIQRSLMIGYPRWPLQPPET